MSTPAKLRPARAMLACRYVDAQRANKFAKLDIAKRTYAGLHMNKSVLEHSSSSTLVTEEFKKHTCAENQEISLRDFTAYCCHLPETSQNSSLIDVAAYRMVQCVKDEDAKAEFMKELEACKLRMLAIEERARIHNTQGAVVPSKRKRSPGVQTIHTNNALPTERQTDNNHVAEETASDTPTQHESTATGPARGRPIEGRPSPLMDQTFERLNSVSVPSAHEITHDEMDQNLAGMSNSFNYWYTVPGTFWRLEQSGDGTQFLP